MVLKKNTYIVQKEVIKAWLKNNPDKEPLSQIGVISVATNCHILVVCEFMGEIVGVTPELEAKKETLRHFYNVERVE